MAPEKSKFPSAADRYKIVNAIGADDLRKKELQERRERERDALLERLREERANPKPAVEAAAERPKQVYLAYKQNGGDADDGSRLTIKLTIPPAWLDKPCAKLARARRRGAETVRRRRRRSRPSRRATTRTRSATPSTPWPRTLRAPSGAGNEREVPNFSLGRFPLVSADFWTSDHLSERPRSVDAFLERARADHSR